MRTQLVCICHENMKKKNSSQNSKNFSAAFLDNSAKKNSKSTGGFIILWIYIFGLTSSFRTENLALPIRLIFYGTSHTWQGSKIKTVLELESKYLLQQFWLFHIDVRNTKARSFELMQNIFLKTFALVLLQFKGNMYWL